MRDSSASLDPLAALLRDGKTLISSLVRDPLEEAALGALAAAGPRAADNRDDYLLLVEAIREGYLLHYGSPRLIEAADPDLRLLAGDFLYALGLERLAALGDLEAVRELADLISLSAQLHAEDGGPDAATPKVLWLASATAVGAGGNEAFEQGKEALRNGGDGTTELLAAAVSEMAAGAGIEDALARASEAIGFAAEYLSDRG
ncbi:MAG: hypothetical protein ACRDK5_06815 [Solirubrobacterales bacterium]